MYDYINAEDTELWDVILDGPYIPTKDVVDGELTKVIPKTRREYNEADRKKIEKNYKAKKLLVCGIGPDEYNKISTCETTKEIWDCLKTTHEGMTQVNESKVDILTTQYENFSMKKGETINEMRRRVLPKSWKSKVNSITEARNLKVLTMDDLIGNLQTYELNRQQGSTVKEGKKEKSVALRTSLNDGSEEEDEMTYLTRRFKKIIKNHGGFQKKWAWSFHEGLSKPEAETQDFKLHRRYQVPDHARRKAHADQVVKKSFAVYGNGSSESEEEEDNHENVSMMAVKDDETVFNSIVSLMEKSNDEENQYEVTLFYLKSDLDTLSIKRLRKLVTVLIDSVDELTTENMIISEKLSLCEDESATPNSQMSAMSVRINIIETKNMLPNEEHGTSEGGKRKLSSFEVELEEKLKAPEFKSVVSVEKNSQLMKDLSKIKEELNHSLKWIDLSKILSNLANQKFNNQNGLEERKQSVLVHGQWMLKAYDWRHSKLLSLEAHQGSGMSFGDEKKGFILGIGKIGRSTEHSIDNVHYVNGLKYNLLSVSQICDKGNEVKFLSDRCLVTNYVTNKVVMSAKRVKNMDVADLDLIEGENLTCLSTQTDNANLWHRLLGHVSSSLLNKHVAGDLVRGLLKLKFSDNIRIQSRGGKKYILVIVDDFSRFTWNMFLWTKDETTGLLVTFAKAIQLKINCKIASIISDHCTEFENTQIEGFCAENGIHHNFSAPRTPKKMGLWRGRTGPWWILLEPC
ncbi:uncharacterized protein LOC125833082 [Solanum verrucosum]|uniref:uncharacterized protein LOC125833082 n=1 Tax=Solanum verrucosum TaxID=315347 RepID=UPI0020D009B7|nr:uncharacterized protein LOC125833082 [Solanum verrucosum]